MKRLGAGASADRDVAHLLKMARFGMVNRLHDAARLVEIAQRLENLQLQNTDLIAALKGMVEFMQRHNDQIAPLIGRDPDAEEMVGLVEKASKPRPTRELAYTQVEIPLGTRIQDAPVVDAKLRSDAWPDLSDAAEIEPPPEEEQQED